jgi:hypothetical protein
VIARLPVPARQVAGTITRAAVTTGLDRILLVAAICTESTIRRQTPN